jgi:hypothetical protein
MAHKQRFPIFILQRVDRYLFVIANSVTHKNFSSGKITMRDAQS